MRRREALAASRGSMLLIALVGVALSGCDDAANSREAVATPAASAPDSSSTAPPAEPTKIATHGTKAAAAAPRVPDKPREITFDTIKFEMEKGALFFRSMLTPEIEALSGKPVRIRGYILPSFQQSGITQFVLVRDNLECCFGPGAALYDCIIVDMRPGKSADYTVRPVTVAGTFAVQELLDPEGKHLAIYHLDGDAVD